MADNIAVTEGNGKTVATDDVGGIQYQLIKPAFGVDGAATLVSSSNPLPITVGSTGTSIGVYFDGSNPSVNIGTPTIAGITGSVGVYFSGSNPTVTEVNSAAMAASLSVLDDWDETDRAKVNPIVGQAGVAAGSGVTGATTIRTVHVTDVATSINIVAQGLAALNIGSTASIFTASGSSAAAQTGGITVIAPSANYNFKIFAYSIQTTGVLASALTFANGNSASQTEFWRPLVAMGGSGSQSTTPIGANLAVTPPGYLFATGTNTTLVIAGNNGATIHYSVSYIKESA